MMDRPVLLLSGGLDSVASWWATGKPPWLHLRYSACVVRGEQMALDRICAISPEFAAAGQREPVNVDQFTRHDGRGHVRFDGDGLLPRFPRDLFGELVAWRMGYNRLQVAWTKDDFLGSAANQEDRERRVNDYLMMFCGTEDDVRIVHPVSHLTRSQLIRAAIDAGCPPEVLWATWSCEFNRDRHCGKSLNCGERWIAFRVAGVEDLTEYESDPYRNGNVGRLSRIRTHLDWWIDNMNKAVETVPTYRVMPFSAGLDCFCLWWLHARKDNFATWLHIPREGHHSTDAVRELVDDPRTGLKGRGNISSIFSGKEIMSESAGFALLAIACANEGADEVLFGFHLEDNSPEGTSYATKTMEFIATYAGGKGVQYVSPFANISKTEMVRQVLAAGCPPDLLLKTWSCNGSPEGRVHDGTCRNCTERAVALRLNGLDDEFEREPFESEYARNVLKHNADDYPYRARLAAAIEAHKSGSKALVGV